MSLREEILDQATHLYAEKGLKFTMQDVAEAMHIAKQTIYHLYPSKESLLLDLCDTGFAKIHAQKQAIMEQDIPLAEKLRKVIVAMPEEYQMLDFRKLEGIGEKYPSVAKSIRKNLETNWEPTLQLMEEGISTGALRSDLSMPVFRMVVTASIESFLSTDGLKEYGITYHDALDYLADLLMKGAEAR